jgi:acetyl-CoA carboxylase carboxyltransferase component
LFAEGGGGRPNDTDTYTVAGLDTSSFHAFAGTVGLVPRVGITSGFCFAGNAALLGCCDVVIATENSNIGMGGPAMIEGGGLGVFAPREIGPADVQTRNGVIDVLVHDEEEAVATAKKYLAYFQGALSPGDYAPQEALRDAIPENRRRTYKVRPIIETLADTATMLELRKDFGRAIVTALVRIGGRAVGIIANDTMHVAGAIDADAADKAARFIQLCDAFALPIVALVDTPGFMVGPEAEKTGLVRHISRMFAAAATSSVPYFAVVLRRGYGSARQAMTAGHFHAPFFTVSWPTGEFGGMNLEGAIRIGKRKELEAIADPKAARAGCAGDDRGSAPARNRDQHGVLAGDRRRHRSGGHAQLDSRGLDSAPPPSAASDAVSSIRGEPPAQRAAAAVATASSDTR